MARVEIYTKFFCPYCARAKRLLEEKGVNYEEYEISGGGEKREEMIQRSGGRKIAGVLLRIDTGLRLE